MSARDVLLAEAAALISLADRLDARFDAAVALIRACPGAVVVTGVGKSYLVGQKISATLASTGTPGFALHPTDAAHGDVGRVRPGDVVLALSASGESDELLALLPALARLGARLIAMTAAPASTLGRAAEVVLDLGPITEACPLRLAPSVSTTAMLAFGDALAFAVMEQRGFSAEDYALRHPAGALGRRLMKVEDLLRGPARTATIGPDATVRQALSAITAHRTGAVFIVEQGRLLGVFTDGDLRRHIEDFRLLDQKVAEVMTAPGRRIHAGASALDAVLVFQQTHIGELPVVDAAGGLLGHIAVKDLVDRGFLRG